jgi:outer membrane receptor protein involved in Fe transport
MTTYPTARPRFIIQSLFALSFGGAVLFGQAVPAPPPATASGATEDPLVLSPFEVVSEQDTGYLATSAQSGTRLRTQLKDIASSISVVTKDFMNDIGATDLESLLVYTLGTEVGGINGNFSDAGVVSNPNGNEIDYDSAFASAMPSTRVRGLTTADVSRDFFITSIPGDNYNVERVEISRGPNAMLFGLGSPSGIINYSLVKADLRRRRTEIEHRTDMYGTQRGTVDHNEVLKRDVLALRVSAMWEKQYFRIEEAFDEDRRISLTGTYRPFKNTTLRVSGEMGEIDSNRPEIRPPTDAYTQWWSMGRPVYNPATGEASALGTPAPGWPAAVVNGAFAVTGSNLLAAGRAGNSNYVSGQIGPITPAQRQMLLVFPDPNSSTMGLGLPGQPGVVGMRGGNINFYRPGPTGALVTDQMRGLREMNRILNNVFHSEDNSFGFWKATQITDPAIFDFYHHMLHGPNKYEWADFDSYNITLEQRFLQNKAGVELSFNRETLDNGSGMGLDSVISGYTLRVDINTHLPNGQINPNFGRPFTTAYSRMSVRAYDRDAARATAYYDLDLRKVREGRLGRFLGRHMLTGTYTQLDNNTQTQNNNFVFNSGIDYNLAAQGQISTASSASRGVPILRYLGPSVANSPVPVTGAFSVPTGQWPSHGTTVPLLWYNEPATAAGPIGTWQSRDFTLFSAGRQNAENTRRFAAATREKVKSAVAIAQSYWLDGKVVSTLGYRRDDVETFNAGAPRGNPALGTVILDENFYPRPVTDQTEESFNWGVVAHAPNFIQERLPFGTELSAFYNKSDNFRPAGQRYNIAGEPIPAETGETREYGAMISTFNGKLVLRAARYETTSGLSSSLVSGLVTPLNNVSDTIDNVQSANLLGLNANNPAGLNAWNDFYNGPIGQMLRTTFRFREVGTDVQHDRRSGEVVATADVLSKGTEFELVYNPTRNWRIAVNVAKAEAIRTNVASELRNLVFNTLIPLSEGPAGLLRSNETNEAVNFAGNVRTSIYNQLVSSISEEGAPTNELRKWRWNGVTNYSFTEGMLKGFGIGGGVRWQDKVAIGYPVITHPEFGNVSDVRHPHFGPTETNYDAWISYGRKFRNFNWRVQLNVQNIGVGNELIPVNAQPDGSIAGWRIAPAQTWALRNTFTF